MINKTVRIIKVGSEDNNLKDINFMTENLQSVGYNVSRTNVGYFENVLVNEIERSVKYTDAVVLVGELGGAKANVLWQAISKVFHQTIITIKQLSKCYGANIVYSTMYSKTLKHPGLTPVMYLQGLFILDFEAVKPTFVNIVLPILKNLNAKLILSRTLIINCLPNEHVLELLPRSDKVQVTCDVSVANTTWNLHLSSTSMSSLLEYETGVTGMFRNVKCDIGSDLSELVYNQQDLHIKKSVKCIEECFEKYSPENVFVSFNGGKDCTVLLHLVLGVLRRNYPNFTGKLFCVYIENSNPFVELNKFIDECRQYYNLDIIKFNKSIKESLTLVLESKPHMKGVLMGTRRTDPFSDHLESFHMTDKDWPQVMRVSPLLDWHYSQIWDYLLHLKVPYCSLYDVGYTSLGSAINTVPNPCLLIDNEKNTYLPAYKLLDGTKERSGRKV